MFTGIIQGLGRVGAMDRRGGETRFTLRPDFALTDYALGESIAVNGVCLTVETFGAGWFTAYASGETMSVTNLGAWQRSFPSVRPASPVSTAWASLPHTRPRSSPKVQWPWTG
jgi:riboflavin synthase